MPAPAHVCRSDAVCVAIALSSHQVGCADLPSAAHRDAGSWHGSGARRRRGSQSVLSNRRQGAAPHARGHPGGSALRQQCAVSSPCQCGHGPSRVQIQCLRNDIRNIGDLYPISVIGEDLLCANNGERPAHYSAALCDAHSLTGLSARSCVHRADVVHRTVRQPCASALAIEGGRRGSARVQRRA